MYRPGTKPQDPIPTNPNIQTLKYSAISFFMSPRHNFSIDR